MHNRHSIGLMFIYSMVVVVAMLYGSLFHLVECGGVLKTFQLSSTLSSLEENYIPEHTIQLNNDTFDIFVFALSWPGSICHKLQPCFKPEYVKDFTIHGLWPTNLQDTFGPAECQAPRFDVSLIQELKSELEIYWHDYKNETFSFWKYEYNKHGTCAHQLPRFSSRPVYDYFYQTLSLRKRMKSIYANLEKNSIYASNSKTYKMETVKEALKASGYGKPSFNCFNGTILLEVKFCLDKDLNFIDCPSQILDLCDSNPDLLLPKNIRSIPTHNDNTMLIVVGVIFGLAFILLFLIVVGGIIYVIVNNMRKKLPNDKQLKDHLMSVGGNSGEI